MHQQRPAISNKFKEKYVWEHEIIENLAKQQKRCIFFVGFGFVAGFLFVCTKNNEMMLKVT